MDNRLKIIKVKAKLSDPKGQLIPRGIIENLTIEIADNVATYFFKDRRTTKRFALIEIEGDKKRGLEQKTFFLERWGKAIVKYPGKSKEEIRNIILEQLNKLGINAKIYGKR